MLGSVHLESSGFLQRPGLCLWLTSAAHRLSPELKPMPLKTAAALCDHVLILASSDFWGLLLQLGCTSPMASVFRDSSPATQCQLSAVLHVPSCLQNLCLLRDLPSDQVCLPAQGTTLAPLNHSFLCYLRKHFVEDLTPECCSLLILHQAGQHPLSQQSEGFAKAVLAVSR